jgi:hypothetical protein
MHRAKYKIYKGAPAAQWRIYEYTSVCIDCKIRAYANAPLKRVRKFLASEEESLAEEAKKARENYRGH